ncbi:MAG: Ni,Fe-hydrogenase I small subunit, partial [Gammaproteobacteria bacterium]
MTRLRSLRWLATTSLLGLMPLAQAETADLLVLYTDSALEHPNGRDIQARIQAAVEWTNQALRNSQADLQLRLVHTAKADARYNGLLTSQSLGQLRADPDVAALRRQYGADFVTMLGPSREWCGIGYVSSGNGSTGQLYNSAANWAYNLVSISCGFATFAHELGHNFGLGHSNIQNSRGGVWDWARGHGEVGVFTTIMGYTSAFQTRNRVQYFSNPQLNACEGRACGVPVGQANEADSTQNINRLNTQLAAFL